MGNPIQKLNEIVSLVAFERTWIEGLAIQQLSKTAELDRMHAVAGMPDPHPGKCYPIGAAFSAWRKSTRHWLATILAAAWACGKPV